MFDNFYLDSHKLQAALLEAENCPLCKIIEDALSWHLETFLTEHVNDVKIRALWREAGGLCAEHTRLLQENGPPLPRAILYHDLISSLIPEPPKRKPLWQREKPQANPCPVCAQVVQIEEGYLGLLGDSLAQGTFREQLKLSAPFCLHHWRTFLRLCKKEGSRDYFQKIQLAKTEKILGDLGEFIRKHDWRYQDEALTTDEAESPHTGAKYLTGSPWLGKRG